MMNTQVSWSENIVVNVFINFQQLWHIFNNCNKLKNIRFYRTPISCLVDGDKIFMALNQTLPMNLNTIILEKKLIVSDYSLKF